MGERQTPNPKIQTPNNSQTSNFKIQPTDGGTSGPRDVSESGKLKLQKPKSKLQLTFNLQPSTSNCGTGFHRGFRGGHGWGKGKLQIPKSKFQLTFNQFEPQMDANERRWGTWEQRTDVRPMTSDVMSTDALTCRSTGVQGQQAHAETRFVHGDQRTDLQVGGKLLQGAKDQRPQVRG